MPAHGTVLSPLGTILRVESPWPLTPTVSPSFPRSQVGEGDWRWETAHLGLPSWHWSWKLLEHARGSLSESRKRQQGLGQEPREPIGQEHTSLICSELMGLFRLSMAPSATMMMFSRFFRARF